MAALLNKLFFPSTTTSTPTSAAAATSSKNSWTSFATGTASLSSCTTTATTTAAAVTATTTTTTNLKKCPNKRSNNNNQSVHSKNYLSHFPFDTQQVRVLVYRECDGRRLLFDSNALEKVYHKERNDNGNSNCSSNSNASRDKSHHQCSSQSTYQNNGNKTSKHSNNNTTEFIDVCAEYGYKHNRPVSNDIKNIGEMVFGASAMLFRGTAFKIHWLPAPSRVLCSQVFLNPVSSSASSAPSPYSTLSMNSLTTPRTSISSEHGSIDGLSMNSFSMPFSVSVSRNMSLTPSERNSMSTCPLDVPDQQSIMSAISGDSGRADSGPRYSSTYSTVTDSGYSGISRSQVSSDQWSSSYQYSTRSSLGSVMSDQSDPLRKLSMDSAFFPSSATHFEGVASDGSLQRRICRNLRTSFENEHSTNDLIGFVSDHYPDNSRLNGGSEGGSLNTPNYRRDNYCANESRSNPEIGKKRDTCSKPSKRAKLGLAVFITMSESFEEEMELFCSEHIALLESMLSRLRLCTERAYLNRKEFYQIMFHSWQTTQQWFNDLFTAPRVKCPVWLSVTTSGSKYSKSVAESFMKELCWLLSFADTKDTHFFISTMITAILTHHLGWVATISAFNSSSALSEASAVAIEQRAKLQQVSQKHPYNALWAQLGDLYGAVGMPPKLARTIIYGTEKLSIERLVNILTYFIRCSEVRRSAKREDFNKELVNSIVSQNKNETLKKSSNFVRSTMKKSMGGGLTRTQTCKQNLNTISDSFDEVSNSGEDAIGGVCEGEEGECEIDGEGESEMESVINEAALVSNAKKNEIPNVLAFRDSRFVQQELRIGNYLMDTGIEKSSVMRSSSYSNSNLTTHTRDGRIRFTVTTPDNIELHVEDENTIAGSSVSSEDGALEAIEIESNETIDAKDNSETNEELRTTKHDIVQKKKSRSFLWQMVPQTVKDGLTLNAHAKVGERCMSNLENMYDASDVDDVLDGYSNGMHNTSKRRSSHLSLSDLITQNSMGKSDRMTWGIEPIKENVSLEEHIHFDYCQKLIERDHGICREIRESGINTGQKNNFTCNNSKESQAKNSNCGIGKNNGNNDNGSGVVFVLGDNEPLINIKRSTEDLVATTAATSNDNKQNNIYSKQQLCALHQRTHASAIKSTNATHSKKHSGVKFNFEEYPQIVTNYMKSKNLVMSNYDLLMEKCTKLEIAAALAAQQQQQKQQHQQQQQQQSTDSETKCITSIENCVQLKVENSNNPTTAAVVSDLSTGSGSGSGHTTAFVSTSQCIICNGILNSYQTPSNATELEFETDEEHSYSTAATSVTSAATTTTSITPTTCNNSSSTKTLHTISSATSIDTIKSVTINHDQYQTSNSNELSNLTNEMKLTKMNNENMCPATEALIVNKDDPKNSENLLRTQSANNNTPSVCRRTTYSGNIKKVSSQRGSISSVAAKCAAVNEAVHLLKLPVPGIKEPPQDEDPPDNMKLRAGFIPSLFLNVCDHYVSDVVLQGTFAPPQKWETVLREDLVLSAHSASLISLPVENIAIVADMESWDVRIISSQAQSFPYTGVQSAPVGMSQLVSSMLEAVQVMNSAGISAYECLSYLEAKLQEIYLQSETLAAFLLETDFCSLSAVTAALNLTENDVPLLLSIASIHTPQISKKCGISFR